MEATRPIPWQRPQIRGLGRTILDWSLGAHLGTSTTTTFSAFAGGLLTDLPLSAPFLGGLVFSFGKQPALAFLFGVNLAARIEELAVLTNLKGQFQSLLCKRCGERAAQVPARSAG